MEAPRALESHENELSRPPRILAVDDQGDSLRLLQVRLQAAGFDCHACSNGEAALRFLAENTVDLAILDIMMPGMDGYEVCRRMKADPRTADVPVLFLTARMDLEDKVRALEEGGHDYINKPVQQPELLARTRAALRVKRLQDQLKRQIELQQQINQLHHGMLGEHWQKTLGQLAASLAHEINNPLAVALGSTQLLIHESGFPSEVQARLQVIDESLQRAARKLRSLLLIAQASRQPQTISLANLVEDLLALVNYEIVLKKLNVATELDPQCVWHGQPGQLARAVLYVLNNAIEAVMGQFNPSILVAAECDAQGMIHIRIGDSGPGVTEEARQRMFEPFFSTKGPPHNGVGLYLANEIVKGAGGGIRHLEDSGRTEFIISLPGAAARPAAPEKKA